jgi:single-stranded DNA-specific DHH superfamily exonuclease
MEQIAFQVGSEKRFFEFVAGLNDKDKIALLSHVDLDGVASAKVVNEVVDADVVRLINYEELNNNLISDFKKRKIKTLILTDLAMDDMEFIRKAGKEFNVLWIDHHKIPEDVNSDKVVYLNPGGKNDFCAAYVCYYLFSRMQNIESYDWLIACACLSDFTVYKNRAWMERIFKKYGDETEIKPMSLENGGLQDLKRTLEFAIIYFKTNKNLKKILDLIGKNIGSAKVLERYADEVRDEIAEVVGRFDKERKEINGRLVLEFTPKFEIASLASSTISMKYPDKAVILIRPINEKLFAMSMRRQDLKEDMDKLIKRILSGLENSGGGGHIQAAGGHFLKKDLEIVRERLKRV